MLDKEFQICLDACGDHGLAGSLHARDTIESGVAEIDCAVLVGAAFNGPFVFQKVECVLDAKEAVVEAILKTNMDGLAPVGFDNVHFILLR